MDLEPLAYAVLLAVGDPASFGDAGAFGCVVAEAGFYWLVLVVVGGELLAVMDLAECLGGLAAAVVEAAEIFVQRAEVCLVDLEV